MALFNEPKIAIFAIWLKYEGCEIQKGARESEVYWQAYKPGNNQIYLVTSMCFTVDTSCNFEIAQCCQKSDVILVTKRFWNWSYQKMYFTKKCDPKLIFFNKKKRKIQIIFDTENWLWKSNFGYFRHLSITPIIKIQ